MSGHSHAKTIMHKKQITDAKRGKIFSKLSRLISVASRDKGGDPKVNSSLKLAIERAREFNMPKEKVEQAIKRGTGEIEGAQLKEVLYEAYGPGKIAIIIEGITDNTNRTLSEVKQVLTQNKGKLATSGSVKWLFERKGCITVNLISQDEDLKNKEKLEMISIDSGAEDVSWNQDILDIYIKPEESEQAKQSIEERGVEIESISLDWVAKEMIEVNEKDKDASEKLFEALDENDAIQNIYSNLKD